MCIRGLYETAVMAVNLKLRPNNITITTFISVTPDPCANSPCQNGGACSAQGSSFSCACVPGYTGSMCETDIDDCASAPCLFGGQCIDRNNSFECICPRMLGGVSIYFTIGSLFNSVPVW